MISSARAYFVAGAGIGAPPESGPNERIKRHPFDVKKVRGQTPSAVNLNFLLVGIARMVVPIACPAPLIISPIGLYLRVVV
jgi:hypothetical protein